MTVQKKDGRIIEYRDNRLNDLNIDYVDITKDGETKTYTFGNPIGDPIMNKAQEQFDHYLDMIKKETEGLREESIKEGLNNLK